MIYLQKVNDEMVSHCHCGDGRVASPGQADCPWCGCGWLFSCIKCRKSFTFAIGVELDSTWEEIAREDVRNYYSGRKEPDDEKVEDLARSMKWFLEDVQAGELYVYLDGQIISVHERDLRLEGMYASLQFDEVPQLTALNDNDVIDSVLANAEFWRKHRRPR